MRFLYFILLFAFIFPSHSINNVNFEQGEDLNEFVFGDREGKDFEILYFFSFSCPACYQLSDVVSGWRDHNVKNSNNIDFRPIPVVFEDYWVFTAKAFFIANGLDLEIDKEIYHHYHVEKKFIVDDESLISFFQEKFSIHPSKIIPFLKSDSLTRSIEKAKSITNKFLINGTPSFIIIDKNKKTYIVNNNIVSSNIELVTSLTYLVKPHLRSLINNIGKKDSTSLSE